MKSLNLKLVILFLSIVTLVSCSKQKDDVPVSPAVGTWEGKYGGGQMEPSAAISTTIHANGTLSIKTFEGVASGTWTLNESTFKAVYKNDNYNGYLNISAKLNDAGNKLTGNWGAGETQADDGKIYFDKQ